MILLGSKSARRTDRAFKPGAHRVTSSWIMQLTLPDIGDLLVAIALLFTALIVLFETLESRRRGQREQRILDAIEEEYRTFCRLGRL